METRTKSRTTRRNDFVSRAYKFARDGNLIAARLYLRQAVACAPLTEFQLFRLRQFFGPETVEEMMGMDGSALFMREMGRRMGGKP